MQYVLLKEENLRVQHCSSREWQACCITLLRVPIAIISQNYSTIPVNSHFAIWIHPEKKKIQRSVWLILLAKIGAEIGSLSQLDTDKKKWAS